MGCDIHCYVEKQDENGKWELEIGWRSDHYEEGHRYFGTEEFKTEASAPIDARNYDLFGFLAGVRSNTTPALYWLGESDDADSYDEAQRGVPKDADASTRRLMEDEDYHSHSWLTLGELRQAWTAAQLAGETEWFDLTDCVQQLEARAGDDAIRIVFAFDN